MFLCLLLLGGLTAICQPKKSTVNLISSQRSQGVKRNGADVIKVYNGVFQQDYSILRSDSAYFYPQINAFDAFGHVNIQQGDTLNIYSDKLNYNGNTHVALLTDNVRMVDKDATLTTNFLTYNTATRIATYTGGGKLVNKDNVLTSTNGYYFARSRDAYFRYNVVLTTVDAVIKNDTLRYNTGTRIAYFYGPTHVYGKKNKDTLYTENGTYNTVNEQAVLIKNNEYTQGTKSLKGDSLFYDRVKGYGRAVKHVVFNDNEQKITLNGDLGTYFQKGEITSVTRNPWVTIVTEQKDSAKTDSAIAKPVENNKTNGKKPAKPVVGAKVPPVQMAANTKPVKQSAADSLKLKLKDTTSTIKRDTMYWVADTLKTWVTTVKDFKIYQEKKRQESMIDTSAAARAKRLALKKPSKFLSITAPKILPDTTYLHPDFFGPPKKQAPHPARPLTKGGKAAPADTVYRVRSGIDSVYMSHNVVLDDTARIRVLIGHHNSKIFKSDFQAVADSIFYSSADSVVRCYVKPMMWSQGSQLSGDTVYLQLRNKKLDNMDIFPRAFVVNVEKNDTAYFNQVSGKKMKGFFKDSKMSRLFVDGNAETIYFSKDSTGNKPPDMLRALTSRMRVNFKDNKVQNILFLVKPEKRGGPVKKFKEDELLLRNFIWKPRLRPESKEQIIAAFDKTHKYHKVAPKSVPAVKPAVKGAVLPLKKGAGAKAVKDSTAGKAITDSLVKKMPVIMPVKIKRDTLKGKKIIN